MDNTSLKTNIKKRKRAVRVRKKLRGTSERPRLCVVKTNAHLYAQLIDDQEGKTICSTSTLSKEVGEVRKNTETATKLGTILADMAKKAGINQMVFDRGPAKYHGLLAAFANAVREAGIQL